VNPPLAELDAILPPDAKPLLVGQAGVFYVEHPIVYNTVFDRDVLEQIAAGRSADEIREALHDRGITHIYVDWSEITRHRKPGGYGFSEFVSRDVFEDLVLEGVLAPPTRLSPEHLLYRVRNDARSEEDRS